MKAIDLIKAMVYDSDLAENGGIVEWRRDVSLRDYFGAVSHRGEMEVATYFYVYDEQYDFQSLPEPDVVVTTDCAGDVYLWKVEE